MWLQYVLVRKSVQNRNENDILTRDCQIVHRHPIEMRVYVFALKPPEQTIFDMDFLFSTQVPVQLIMQLLFLGCLKCR